ncbi:MAG: 2-oxoglutarate dehydrogenase complex dihydrolipoyllysine-residue succinyltransferase, partial [Anaerolineales bacterium]
PWQCREIETMTREIKVPDLGESVVEATVGRWMKEEGDTVEVGESVVSLETDKVDLEVGSEVAGVLQSIKVETGTDVSVGDVLAEVEEGKSPKEDRGKEEPTPAEDEAPEPETGVEKEQRSSDDLEVTPVAQQLAEDKGVELSQVEGTGKDGRILKKDVQSHLQEEPSQDMATEKAEPVKSDSSEMDRGGPVEKVRLTRRRRTIARRLVEAQQQTAMLTTFNDVDMSAVLGLREEHSDDFEQEHGVALGITSFFVRASVLALKEHPRFNAEIDGDNLLLKKYYDIGVAVGAEDGLVVPVIRGADKLAFHEIEGSIDTLAGAAHAGELSLEQLRGGTFSITNGGVFGSLLSTPILNPPQVGILGLHRIEKRAVVRDDEIVIRPMMYVALSYDHRVVDGREAVQFLASVKEYIENPELAFIDASP